MFYLPGNELKLFLIVTIISGYVLYALKRRYSHWKDLKVPHVGFPQDLMFCSQVHRTQAVKLFYEQLAPHPIGGIYENSKPILLIRDPEVIQSILIKDFSSFVNRDPSIIIDEKLNPLQPHMFNLRDERWRHIRTKLTPTFSPSKIRSMCGLFDECTKVLHEHLDQSLKNSDEIEVLGLMFKFALDVIGICAFGLECNAIKDKNSGFKRIVSLLTPKKHQLLLRRLVGGIHPKLLNWLNMKVLNVEVEDFFLSLTKEAIKNRADNSLNRKDYMQLLIDIQHEEQEMLQNRNDKSEPLFPDHVLAAHVFLFFLAGFDTTATALGYCLYELALHPDMMDRLYKEVKQVEKAHNGKLDYDAFKSMHYMESFVSETLRKHPPAGLLNRSCNTDYKVPNSSLLIKKGTKVNIPVYALHHDPKYFPEPQKFDPERFNERNKSKIIPGSYLPFGDGPRMCIGMRFAQMEIKSALSKIIIRYTVHPTEKTEIPITSNPSAFLNAPKKIFLRFQKRNCS